MPAPIIGCPYWRTVFGTVVTCQREAHGDDKIGHLATYEDEDGFFEIRFPDPPEEGGGG